MQMRHRRVSGIARIGNFLTLGHSVTDLGKYAVFPQVVVLAGCTIAVQDYDEVREFAAAVLPTALGVRLLNSGDDTSSCGMYRCADGHIQVNCKFFESCMTEA